MLFGSKASRMRVPIGNLSTISKDLSTYYKQDNLTLCSLPNPADLE